MREMRLLRLNEALLVLLSLPPKQAQRCVEHEMRAESSRVFLKLKQLPIHAVYIAFCKLYSLHDRYYALVYGWYMNAIASKYFEISKYGDALVACKGALEVWPTNTIFKRNAALISTILGRLAFRQGKLEKAFSYLLDAVTYAPNNEAYRKDCAGVCNEIGVKFSEHYMYQEASPVYKKGLEIWPHHAAIMKNLAFDKNEQGLIAYHKASYHNAAVCFREALSYNSEPAYERNLLIASLRLWKARADDAGLTNYSAGSFLVLCASASFKVTMPDEVLREILRCLDRKHTELFAVCWIRYV